MLIIDISYLKENKRHIYYDYYGDHYQVVILLDSTKAL